MAPVGLLSVFYLGTGTLALFISKKVIRLDTFFGDLCRVTEKVKSSA